MPCLRVYLCDAVIDMDLHKDVGQNLSMSSQKSFYSVVGFSELLMTWGSVRPPGLPLDCP